MNYFLVIFGQVQTDYRLQTESDVYEPTVQSAQVGSKIDRWHIRQTFRNKNLLYHHGCTLMGWVTNQARNTFFGFQSYFQFIKRYGSYQHYSTPSLPNTPS